MGPGDGVVVARTSRSRGSRDTTTTAPAQGEEAVHLAEPDQDADMIARACPRARHRRTYIRCATYNPAIASEGLEDRMSRTGKRDIKSCETGENAYFWQEVKVRPYQSQVPLPRHVVSADSSTIRA